MFVKKTHAHGIYSIGALFFGALFYAYYQGILIVAWASFSPQTALKTPASPRKITCFIWNGSTMLKEQRSILFNKQIAHDARIVAAAWFDTAHEEKIIPATIAVLSTAIHDHALLICTNQAWLPAQKSTYDTWMLLESLCATIREQIPTIKSIQFVTQRGTLHDVRLDLNEAWPITGFIDQLNAQPAAPKIHFFEDKKPLVMLCACPHTGRSMGNQYERGMTLSLATALRDTSMREGLPTRYTLYTSPEHYSENHEEYFIKASTANRARVDLSIDLRVFHTNANSTEIFIFYNMHDPAEIWATQRQTLEFIPVHAAQKKYSVPSYQCAQLIHAALAAQNIAVKKTVGLPLTALRGIQRPAILIEIGIQKTEQLAPLVPLLAQALGTLQFPDAA